MTNESTERVSVLVQRLIAKTNAQVLEWRPALRENAFVSVINRGGFEISQHAALDEAGDYYELAIMDAGGRVADRYSSEPGFSGADTSKVSACELGQLYRLARSAAMASESLVDELISELA